jgi:hypothetical protein
VRPVRRGQGCKINCASVGPVPCISNGRHHCPLFPAPTQVGVWGLWGAGAARRCGRTSSSSAGGLEPCIRSCMSASRLSTSPTRIAWTCRAVRRKKSVKSPHQADSRSLATGEGRMLVQGSDCRLTSGWSCLHTSQSSPTGPERHLTLQPLHSPGYWPSKRAGRRVSWLTQSRTRRSPPRILCQWCWRCRARPRFATQPARQKSAQRSEGGGPGAPCRGVRLEGPRTARRRAWRGRLRRTVERKKCKTQRPPSHYNQNRQSQRACTYYQKGNAADNMHCRVNAEKRIQLCQEGCSRRLALPVPPPSAE